MTKFHPPGAEDTPGALTIGKAAAAFHRADATFSAAYHARQIRYLVQVGALRPVNRRGAGGNAAFVLSPVELLQARVLCAALQVGIAADVLADAPGWLGNVLVPNEPGRVVVTGWPRIVADLRTGRDWFFCVEIPMFGSARGYLTTDPTEAVIPARGLDRKASIVLPLLPLLTPILADAEEA